MHSEQALAPVSGLFPTQAPKAQHKLMFLGENRPVSPVLRRVFRLQNILDLTAASGRHQQNYPQPAEDPIFPFAAGYLGEFLELPGSIVR